MTTTLHVVKVEAFDAAKDLVFTVETFDECTAVVTLKETCHSSETWAETAADIGRAIELLKLEKA